MKARKLEWCWADKTKNQSLDSLITFSYKARPGSWWWTFHLGLCRLSIRNGSLSFILWLPSVWCYVCNLCEGSQCCGSQSLECSMPVVFLFIVLAPTQQHTEEFICGILSTSQEVVSQVFFDVPWSGHYWLCSLWHVVPGIPDSVVFVHWWNLVFLQVLRLPTFEENKFLVFECIFVIFLWLEHCGSCGLAVMTAPLLFLASASSHSFSCFALENRTRHLMDHPVPEVTKPLWCITSREVKSC